MCVYIDKTKVAKIRNRYNQVPYLTQNTTWESDKNTIKYHKQEARGQPYHKAAINGCLIFIFIARDHENDIQMYVCPKNLRKHMPFW